MFQMSFDKSANIKAKTSANSLWDTHPVCLPWTCIIHSIHAQSKIV